MIEHRYEDAGLNCCVFDCLGYASWEPVIYTWPTGGKLVAPTQFELDMPICDLHRLNMNVKEFLCEEVWTGILDWAHRNKKPIPDRMTAEVRFKKLDNKVMVH